MFDHESIPGGLDTMRPGPTLVAFLATIDRSALTGHDRVIVMRARNRQVAHDQAELFADMVAVSDATGETASGIEVAEMAAAEIRAALSLTRRTADWELGLAYDLRERLPQVWEALYRGDIDLRKARTIANRTSDLSTEVARQLIKSIIDEAPRLTTGQLTAKILRLRIEIDPDEAAERYEHGVSERRVVIEANDDGTASIYAMQLPPERATAISRKLNKMAIALKRSDEARTMDQLRADMFVDLLQGRSEAASTGRGTVDIRVDVETLAGLTDRPGDLGGYGPVIADIARQVAVDGKKAEWRFSVTDPQTGLPIVAGTTRRRPTTAQRRSVQAHHSTCVFPGCRMPATDCDLDHNQPWAHGGPTTEANLGPLCRHDHVIKDGAGWQLRRTGPAEYAWTSPLGHTDITTGQSP